MKFLTTVAVMQVALLMAGVSLAEEAPQGAKKPKAKVVRRLPNNYGKIGLSNSQKDKIYGIQADYRTRIQALLRELEDLRTQQSLDIQSVLNEDQKKELNTILENSRKKRAAARAKKKK